MIDISEINRLVADIYPKTVAIRREIHQYPELAFSEINTARIIKDFLDNEGIPYQSQVAKTGVVALIKGQYPGKTLALRADMDALPIMEENDLPFASKVKGVMHACGHDIHTAVLLGAGFVLNKLRNRLCGNIKLIFQPAEEGTGGAELMIEQGVLDNPKVDACACLHVWPTVDLGDVEVKHGAIMACPDNFEIVIKGKGGHGAAPHEAVDPIVVGCNVVSSIQALVSRRINPLIPCVITIGCFNAGTCNNVIPEQAVLKGTARTFDPELRAKIPQLLEETVAGVAKSMGADYQFSFTYLYPPTINDKAVTDAFVCSAIRCLGEQNVKWTQEPSMAGEDFAYFGEKVPSTLVRLGCRPKSAEKTKLTEQALHSPTFNPQEGCIEVGIKTLAQFGLDYLEKST